MTVKDLKVKVNADVNRSDFKKIERLLKGIEKRIDKINSMKINVSVNVVENKNKWFEFWK